MKVIIMSGLPGSGKSTMVKDMEDTALTYTVSADNFFMVDGIYRFDPTKIQDAHDCCLREFLGRLMYPSTEDPQILVVDNTNTSAVEIAPYYRIAQALGHEVEIFRLHIDPSLAVKRNIHGVPAKTIMEMYTRLMTDVLPPWWKIRHQWYG